MTTPVKPLKTNVRLSSEDVEWLRAGAVVLLTGGTVSTARDAAHSRMFEFLEWGETLHVDLRGIGGEL